MKKLVNLLLKSLSLLAKFAFILLAGREISEADFGNYGLFSALLVYILGFVGLEYHAYSNRALLLCNGKKKEEICSNQIAFIIFAIFLCIPISGILKILDFIPLSLGLWFFLILIMEYISTEMIRLMNILDRQIKATLVYSIKTSCWMIPMVIAWLADVHVNVIDIYKYWFLLSLTSVLFGFFCLRDYFRIGFKIKLISFQFIWSGVLNSKLILISSQMSLLLFVADRYLLKYTAGIESVSAYFFYFMLASSLLSVLESSVFVFLIPELIRKVNEGDSSNILKAIVNMRNVAMLAVTIFSLTIVFIVDFIIEFVDKASFKDHKEVFYILIMFVVLRVYSLTFHYVLYAAKYDRELMLMNFFSLIIFVVFYYSCLFLGGKPIISIAASMTIVSAFHIIVKRFWVNKFVLRRR